MRKPAVIVFGFVAVLVFAFVAGSGLYQQQRSKELGFIAQKLRRYHESGTLTYSRCLDKRKGHPDDGACLKDCRTPCNRLRLPIR